MKTHKTRNICFDLETWQILEQIKKDTEWAMSVIIRKAIKEYKSPKIK